MVEQSVQYSPTEINGILSSLDKFFGAMDPGATYTRAAGNNVIVPISADFNPEALSALIAVLVKTHPSRIFVIINDNKATTITAEVSAQCQMLSKNEHTCSEIIRITANESNKAALPEIVLANLITGRPIELFLLDCSIDISTVKLFSPLVEQVVFNSSDFNEHLKTLSFLASSGLSLVDAQWICQSVWHEQIRLAFERLDVRQSLAQLRSIEISGARLERSPVSISTILVSGWIVSSLKLDVSSFGLAGYDCIGSDGGIVGLSINSEQTADQDSIESVSFSFSEDGAKIQSVVVKRSGNIVEGLIKSNELLRFSAGLEPMSHLAALERYYSIGESVANYPAALRCAIDLENLRLGYVAR